MKDNAAYKGAREKALGAMIGMLFQNQEVKKGLYRHPGLITALVCVTGKEGVEWKVARESALVVIINSSTGSAEVKKACMIMKD
jgi:hypothetical protein